MVTSHGVWFSHIEDIINLAYKAGAEEMQKEVASSAKAALGFDSTLSRNLL
jgi:hypothetical protein